MAKIVVKVPEPKEEYDFSNQKQISRALTAIIEQLNSTFLQQQKRGPRTIYLVYILVANIYKKNC